MVKPSSSLPSNYPTLLSELKECIRTAQVKAALAVNRELVLLYWRIGQEIVARQQTEKWGAKVITSLSKDLRAEFPGFSGLSVRNLQYMKTFAEAYPDPEFAQQAAAQIPWFHNCLILDKVRDPKQRVWYILKTIENGWSRSVLAHQIDGDLFRRQGGAITNFQAVLPQPQSDLAQSLLKSEYNLEFLQLQEKALERELERALLEHMQKFLLELGVGFAFVGSQYRLEVDGDEFFVDLLFYHLDLRCFVVIELKTTDFRPEYSGQINFYVNVIDDKMRRPGDEPTIGIVLCKDKNKAVVQYSLRGITQPISVSTYRTKQTLPADLKEKLPSIEELEHEIEAVVSAIEESKETSKAEDPNS